MRLGYYGSNSKGQRDRKASMRPRRMRLGYAQHTTCCFPRQYRGVFEQWLFHSDLILFI